MIEIRQKAFMYRHAYLIVQVKPHFVFNALNTVISTIHEDAYLAERLAHSFSTFLSSTINQENMDETLPCESEIETLKAYLEIELARYNDILVRIDTEPIPDIKLPPFTLQPLVENAIKHGLSPKQKGGRITFPVSRKRQIYSVRT
jgi:two-component system, sensor histidine kinase ChiS